MTPAGVDGTTSPDTEKDMINISVSARALVAARAVDPQVSTAAVRAAVEAALAEQRRELDRRRQLADEATAAPATRA